MFFYEKWDYSTSFFDCHIAKFLWRAIYISFGLKPPNSISNVARDWLGGIDSKKIRDSFLKEHLLYVGLFGWLEMRLVLINLQINIIFKYFSGQHTGFGSRYSFKVWRKQEANIFVYQNLEITVMHIFTNFDWRFTNRLL